MKQFWLHVEILTSIRKNWRFYEYEIEHCQQLAMMSIADHYPMPNLDKEMKKKNGKEDILALMYVVGNLT